MIQIVNGSLSTQPLHHVTFTRNAWNMLSAQAVLLVLDIVDLSVKNDKNQAFVYRLGVCPSVLFKKSKYTKHI
jgi:hypothetical protein